MNLARSLLPVIGVDSGFGGGTFLRDLEVTAWPCSSSEFRMNRAQIHTSTGGSDEIDEVSLFLTFALVLCAENAYGDPARSIPGMMEMQTINGTPLVPLQKPYDKADGRPNEDTFSLDILFQRAGHSA